jgi:two-component system chemotaxis response regulator CheB
MLLREDPKIDVIGEARDGVEAVDCARKLRPDVITMDVSMPRLSGLDAITTIMADAPSRIIVVCSVRDEIAIDLSFRAVAAGALELIPKPRVESVDDIKAWGKQVREAVRLMSEVPVVRRRRSPLMPSAASMGAPGRLDALGIAASTGGPPAVAAILGDIRRDIAIPVFIAQHVAPGFSEGLRRWLETASGLPCVLPRDGALTRGGHVYLAPDNRDLEVDAAGAIRLAPPRSLNRPSANILFVSMVTAYGARAGAVVLTGMGEDGAAGVRAIKAAGGIALAQDEASSVVGGMPRAASDAGATVVPLAEIAGRIRALCLTSKKK